MGTITFTTDLEPGAVLMQEMADAAFRVRMFTTDHESACVALRVDLRECGDDLRAHVLATYDLPENVQTAIVGVIFKQSGLNGRGVRSVSLKEMTEEMGPYYTGGATAQLLNILSPLRKDAPAAKYAQEWRKRAWFQAASLRGAA